jgi:hypothetical protein
VAGSYWPRFTRKGTKGPDQGRGELDRYGRLMAWQWWVVRPAGRYTGPVTGWPYWTGWGQDFLVTGTGSSLVGVGGPKTAERRVQVSSWQVGGALTLMARVNGKD